jgi:hypothetical protein
MAQFIEEEVVPKVYKEELEIQFIYLLGNLFRYMTETTEGEERLVEFNIYDIDITQNFVYTLDSQTLIDSLHNRTAWHR